MGAPLASVGAVKDIGGGVYIVRRPPIPNGDFEGVSVMGFADVGICRIVAMTPQFVGDSSGAQAKQAVDNFSKVVAAKYGAYTKKVDDCSDSVGCDAGWLGDVRDNQAQYGYNWRLFDQHRPDGITGVALRVVADDAFTSRAEIAYFSANESTCVRESQSASGKGL